MEEILKNYSKSEISSANSFLEMLKGKSHSEVTRILRVANYLLSSKSKLS